MLVSHDHLRVVLFIHQSFLLVVIWLGWLISFFVLFLGGGLVFGLLIGKIGLLCRLGLILCLIWALVPLF